MNKRPILPQEIEDDLARLSRALDELEVAQHKADKLLIRIADSGVHGAKTALCRELDIQPQSLPDRLAAARKRIAAMEPRSGGPG